MYEKTGLDYFPLVVDFFEDEKIQYVSARFGLKGEAIIVRLLCRIYRQGYYMVWDDDTALLFAKGVGDGCRDSCVKDVVCELAKRGFFDKGILDRFMVLTSRCIQKRYLSACARRKKVVIDARFLLVDPSEFHNVLILRQNVDILDENDVILPERKVKESKVKCVCSADAPQHTHTERPTLEGVKTICSELGLSLDPAAFFEHYEASGWRDKFGHPILSLEQKLRQWERGDAERKALGQAEQPRRGAAANFPQPETDYAAFEEAYREKMMREGF